MDYRYIRCMAFGMFIATIIAANYAVNTFGIIPIGFGLMAPAGVFFAGWGFTNRDWLQDVWGKRAVVAAILCGALLSAILSPALALASASAFLLSELLDFALYTPLKAKHWLGAVVLSNTFGAAVDSVVFLWLAFGSLEYFLGQFVGKSYITLLFVLAVWGIRWGIRVTQPATFNNADW